MISLHMPPHFCDHLRQSLHLPERGLRLVRKWLNVSFLKVLLHRVIPDAFGGLPALVEALVGGVELGGGIL